MMAERNMTRENAYLTDQQAKLNDALQHGNNTGKQGALEDGELESDDDAVTATYKKRNGSTSSYENSGVDKRHKAYYRDEKPSTSFRRRGDDRMDYDGRGRHGSFRRRSVERMDYDRSRKHSSTRSKYDDRMDYDDRGKHESSKRRHETQSKKYSEEIKKPKDETSKRDLSSSSVSISPKPTSTSPNQHVSSLWGDYKIPKKGSNTSSSSSSTDAKPRQPLSTTQANPASNSSLLEKYYEDYISSNLPKPKQYLSPQPAVVAPTAAVAKTQAKLSKSSSRGFSVSPRPITGGKHISLTTRAPPITGGKTIRMTQQQPSRHEPYKHCKPQSPPINGFPRCELLTDNGIKMIIRFPKKV